MSTPESDDTKTSTELLQLPEWLTTSILETKLKDNLSVNSVEIVNAIAPGENYACIVYRAVAHTSLGPVPLIIKSMPEAEVRAKMMREAQVTVKEIRMYEHTIPLLRGDVDTLRTATCYLTIADGVRDTLVFEDLGASGFVTRKRHLGLDEAHCRLALTQLAHLHGFSVALKIQNPTKFDEEMKYYRDLIYTKATEDMFKPFLQNLMKNLSESLRDLLPFRYREITKIIEHIGGDHLYDKMVSAFNPAGEEQPVVVLNHGDFWNNNMMFQYNEESGEPQVCIPIDFQASRRATPSFDLLYFLYTSTTQATRRQYQDQLLQLYLDQVHWALAQKGVQDPGKAFFSNLDELKADMRKHALIGFVMVCFVLPLVVVDPDNVINMDDLTEENMADGSSFNQMYRGELFTKRMREFIEDFDDFGFFQDYLKVYPEAIANK